MWRVLFLLFFCGGASARYFNNPVLEGDHPDPGVILLDGVYYAVTTTSDINQTEKFPISISRDLQNWTRVGYIFNESNLPKWSAPHHPFWAPEIHRVGDEFRVYFTSTESTDTLCVGVASSKNVTGPYIPQDQPLVIYPDSFTFDATLVNINGSLKLLFSLGYNITIRNLTDDGLTLKDDITTRLFYPDLEWEGRTTEGPWYLSRNGYHYIFYSGNNFCSGLYAMGVARSNVSVTGPYVKLPEPLLVSDNRFKGPGHGSIVRDIDGEGYVFVHHGYRAGAVCGGNPRVMFSTSMEWGDDDWPKKMFMT